jgi:hypothetical protein
MYFWCNQYQTFTVSVILLSIFAHKPYQMVVYTIIRLCNHLPKGRHCFTCLSMFFLFSLSIYLYGQNFQHIFSLASDRKKKNPDLDECFSDHRNGNSDHHIVSFSYFYYKYLQKCIWSLLRHNMSVWPPYMCRACGACCC